MEFWTKKKDQLSWNQWPDDLQGILGMFEFKHDSLLLVTDRPNDEVNRLQAVIVLVRKIFGSKVTITLASPYPSNQWLGPLIDSGIDHVWVIERGIFSNTTRVDNPDRLQSNEDLCPELHTRTNGDVTLSVCGRHHDHMVVVRNHIQRWCLAHHLDCPHWRKEK